MLKTRQIVPCEGTAGNVSFTWSNYKVLSTDSKFRNAILVSMIASPNRRVDQ